MRLRREHAGLGPLRAVLFAFSCVALSVFTATCRQQRPSPPDGTDNRRQAVRSKSVEEPDRAPAASSAATEEDFFAELDADAGASPEPTAACFELRGAKECPGVGVVMMGCNAVMSVLEQEAGDRFLRCVVGKNDSESLCSASVLKTCGLSAIEATPAVPQAPSICNDLFRKCPAPPDLRDVYTPDTCRAGLSSLRERPRSEFIECMRRRCDLKLCVGELF